MFTYNGCATDTFAYSSTTAEERNDEDDAAQNNDQNWDEICVDYITEVRQIANIVDHNRAKNDK